MAIDAAAYDADPHFEEIVRENAHEGLRSAAQLLTFASVIVVSIIIYIADVAFVADVTTVASLTVN